MKSDYDRRSGGSLRANVVVAIQILTLAAQLTLGAVAWGRLDGRLSSLEENVKILMQSQLAR